MTRVHVFISGIVQGVNFRYFTRQKALALGLTGWVRNLSDGRVESVIEGKKDKLQELLKWFKTEGSPASHVREVELSWEKATGEFETFAVAYEGRVG